MAATTGWWRPTSPAAASRISVTGAGPLAVKGGEGPTWVVGAPLTLTQGETATVVVRFRMPGQHGSITGGAVGPRACRAMDSQRADVP